MCKLGFNYGSVWLKMRTLQHILVKLLLCIILTKSVNLWNKKSRPIMVIHELLFVMDQYFWKLELLFLRHCTLMSRVPASRTVNPSFPTIFYNTLISALSNIYFASVISALFRMGLIALPYILNFVSLHKYLFSHTVSSKHPNILLVFLPSVFSPQLPDI